MLDDAINGVSSIGSISIMMRPKIAAFCSNLAVVHSLSATGLALLRKSLEISANFVTTAFATVGIL